MEAIELMRLRQRNGGWEQLLGRSRAGLDTAKVVTAGRQAVRQAGGQQ